MSIYISSTFGLLNLCFIFENNVLINNIGFHYKTRFNFLNSKYKIMVHIK